jgi:hypothetical protein
MSQQQRQQENQMNANNNSDNTKPEILEQGDIYFFYRPKKGAEEVKGIEDVRRFFMVTAPEKSENTKENSDKNQLLCKNALTNSKITVSYYYANQNERDYIYDKR